ncbi:MAG: hypothetical protein DMG49_09170 [Acidobacteria bacterium]|nr:MAG: hypothetical protein DMG49_09170 [Acidobacteriota bacterium]
MALGAGRLSPRCRADNQLPPLTGESFQLSFDYRPSALSIPGAIAVFGATPGYAGLYLMNSFIVHKKVGMPPTRTSAETEPIY